MASESGSAAGKDKYEECIATGKAFREYVDALEQKRKTDFREFETVRDIAAHFYERKRTYNELARLYKKTQECQRVLLQMVEDHRRSTDPLRFEKASKCLADAGSMRESLRFFEDDLNRFITRHKKTDWAAALLEVEESEFVSLLARMWADDRVTCVLLVEFRLSHSGAFRTYQRFSAAVLSDMC